MRCALDIRCAQAQSLVILSPAKSLFTTTVLVRYLHHHHPAKCCLQGQAGVSPSAQGTFQEADAAAWAAALLMPLPDDIDEGFSSEGCAAQPFTRQHPCSASAPNLAVRLRWNGAHCKADH